MEGILSSPDDLPTFVYRPARVAEKTALIRATLPGVTLLYAVKANRHPAILEPMLASADRNDVHSHTSRIVLASRKIV